MSRNWSPLRPRHWHDVHYAAQVLDEHEEHGWARRISVDTLDLLASNTCILGQLHGDVHEGIKHYQQLGLVEGQYGQLGRTDNRFLRALNIHTSTNTSAFVSTVLAATCLRRLWVDEIDERLRREEVVPEETSVVRVV